MSELSELRPCPFCGCSDKVELYEVSNPDSYWDSHMRGEFYYGIICHWCDLIMKDDDEDALIKRWNSRGDPE